MINGKVTDEELFAGARAVADFQVGPLAPLVAAHLTLARKVIEAYESAVTARIEATNKALAEVNDEVTQLVKDMDPAGVFDPGKWRKDSDA